MPRALTHSGPKFATQNLFGSSQVRLLIFVAAIAFVLIILSRLTKLLRNLIFRVSHDRRGIYVNGTPLAVLLFISAFFMLLFIAACAIFMLDFMYYLVFELLTRFGFDSSLAYVIASSSVPSIFGVIINIITAIGAVMLGVLSLIYNGTQRTIDLESQAFINSSGQ